MTARPTLRLGLFAIVAFVVGLVAARWLLVPREVPAFVIDALIGEIHILPTEIIDPVILYYRQILAISQLADDLRSERFDKLEASRKVELYNDYIELMIYARTLSNEAIEVITESLAGGEVNSPA